MTTERRKALLLMTATLVVGILIGVLAMGFFARRFYSGDRPMNRKEIPHRGNFAGKIIQVVKADSAQAKLMKPIIEQTMSHIDQLQEQGDRDARAAMDSMKVKLTLILKPEQVEHLEKFISKKRPSGKERGGREGRGHH